MAAASPTTTLAAAGIQQPHPLKGIVNSNDDPTRCAGCSASFQDLREVRATLICCGRGVCESCFDVEEKLKHCPQCNVPMRGTSKEFAACLKKHSKKGHPWAQASLAILYIEGDEIRQSISEARHWYCQAAKRGHPIAMRDLGKWFLYGRFGCPVDLRQAQEYFEAGLKASKASHSCCYEFCQEGLVGVAKCHLEAKSFEKAKAMLLPLAEEGVGTAQEAFGDAILQDCEEGLSYHDCSSALFWYSSAAFALEGGEAASGAALGAMICSSEGLPKYAQAKFWGRIIKKSLRHPEINGEARIGRVKELVLLQRKLRGMRDVCGGCGAEFEGEERKFCRACRAYCYCSRECQKMHWNRKEGGHREDCKGASELKQKMKEKKKAGAIKPSESK